MCNFRQEPPWGLVHYSTGMSLHVLLWLCSLCSIAPFSISFSLYIPRLPLPFSNLFSMYCSFSCFNPLYLPFLSLSLLSRAYLSLSLFSRSYLSSLPLFYILSLSLTSTSFLSYISLLSLFFLPIDSLSFPFFFIFQFFFWNSSVRFGQDLQDTNSRKGRHAFSESLTLASQPSLWRNGCLGILFIYNLQHYGHLRVMRMGYIK